MSGRNYRELSRANWTPAESAQLNDGQIQTGCLQRVADAVEKVAASYDRLRSERDMYERWYHEQRGRVAARDRQIAALRGAITRLQNKIRTLKAR